MAGIGFGMMGPGNMANFLEKPEVQWVAVCDLDTEPLAMAKGMVDKKYGNKACATYHDFRELFLRKDLDAVSIAVPDHWHAILAISALRAGLDVYGEKPLTHNLREGRALCDAVKRYGRVWQTGSWQRSVENFHQACELVRNGRIGKVKRIEVGLPSGHYDFAGTFGQEALVAPPAEPRLRILGRPGALVALLQGPRPHELALEHGFRRRPVHGLDRPSPRHRPLGHGLGRDRPGRDRGRGEYPTSGIYNSPTRYYVKAKYADGTPMVLAGGHDEIWSGTKWIGEYGWIWVDRGQFETEPASLKREVIGPDEIRLYKSRDHHQNFLDCVRSRAKTITPAETAHRSASVGHLGVIAMEVGRKINWDPATETIIGDPEAERLLGHSYRKPWQLPE